MTPTQLSQSAPVLALAKIQLERQLPDGDFCRTVKFDMSGSSWGKIGSLSGSQRNLSEFEEKVIHV